MKPMSAPANCPSCSDLVRNVVDVDAHTDLVIDADQVGANVGNVNVVTVAEGTGLWLVECRDRPGPPGPPERYDAEVPPALFTVHICPVVPGTWAAAAAELELEGAAS
jgi:hypothetical protein